MARGVKSIAQQARDRERLAPDHWSRGEPGAPLRIDGVFHKEYASAIRTVGKDGVDAVTALHRIIRLAIEAEKTERRSRELERVLLQQAECMNLITKKHVELANAYNALAAAFREQTAAIQTGFDKQTAAMESHLAASRGTAEEVVKGSKILVLCLQAFEDATLELKNLATAVRRHE